MSEGNPVRNVQWKILEIMKYIDGICRKNGITYFIMGGTALGAVRHGGFIPWDDDLDIFMVPSEYEKFKVAFEEDADSRYMIQEWRTSKKYLEYAKVRMNGTTFIEESFKDCKNMHQGIYVDIMMLHKVPAQSRCVQQCLYLACKFVTLYGLTQRNWKPKAIWQSAVIGIMKILPCQLIADTCYKLIYKYKDLKSGFKWCYWITPAKFRAGLFDRDYFENPVDIQFEDTYLLCPTRIKDYLKYRYGDYMKLPSKEAQMAAVHAYIYDVNRDYSEYMK